MICPNCGSECENGSKFCLACGTKLESENVHTPSENLYSQDYSGGAPSSFSGGGAVVSATKSGSKKFLIITLVVLIVVALGIGGFFFIRNKLQKEDIIKNPTKYVSSSYENFFDEVNAESEFYKILKDSAEQGSVKLSVDADLSAMGLSQPAGVELQYSYDVKNNKCYLKLDGGKLVPLMMFSVSQEQQNFLTELYSNIDRTDFSFDILGKQGKYYVDLGKFREQITNSIFSPDKENVLGISKESFEEFVSAVESMYQSMKKNGGNTSADMEKKIDDFVKKLEKNGKVTVESGDVTVGSETRKVDIITYTYDFEGIRNLISDIKAETVSYMEENKDTLGENAQQSIDETKEGFDKMIKEFETSADKNAKLTLKNYVSKDNKQPVKTELVLENIVSGSDNARFEISAEFTRKPNAAINFKMTNGKQDVTISLSKEVKDNTTSFVFEAKRSDSQDTLSARLDYDKDSKIFTISAGEVSISGTAEVKDDAIVIGYEQDLAKMGGAGKVSLKLEISSKAQMNEINAEKSLFSITMDELQGLAGSLGASGGSDYDYDYDYDYHNDDDYDYSDAQLKSDAATVDNALKTYYAGIIAGAIDSSATEPDGTPISNLPAKGASSSERKAAADAATVGDALKYHGLDIPDTTLYSLMVTKDGNIVVWNGEEMDNFKDVTVSTMTTLGEIYGAV